MTGRCIFCAQGRGPILRPDIVVGVITEAVEEASGGLPVIVQAPQTIGVAVRRLVAGSGFSEWEPQQRRAVGVFLNVFAAEKEECLVGLYCASDASAKVIPGK